MPVFVDKGGLCFLQEIHCVYIDKILIIIVVLLINKMKQWMTLVGYCLVTFINAMGYGVFANNIDTFARYYNVQSNTIQSVYYLGLAIQILFCVPALKMIEWRFDYAIYAASYFATCGFWLFYFSNHTFSLVVVSYALNSIGGLFILPTTFYFAQRWFCLEKRSLVIAAGFYFNFMGYATGGLLSTLYVRDVLENVKNLGLILSVVSSLIFPFSIILVRNRPKVRIEKEQKIGVKHLKMLWKNKFVAFNMITTSAVIGVSWNFQATIFQLDSIYKSDQIGVFISVWVVSGCTFGLLISYLIHFWSMKTGQFKYYDWTSNTLFITNILGLLAIGICFQLQYKSYPLNLALTFVVGVAQIGFFGVTFFSMLQTLYPLPSLLLGTLIIVGSSFYSFGCQGINFVDPNVNIYFSMLSTLILPWVYFFFTYETNFKRYKSYLNQKQAKYELIKLEQVSVKQE